MCIRDRPIFALIMWLVYYVSVSTAGGIFTDWANDGVFGDGWHLFTIGAADYEDCLLYTSAILCVLQKAATKSGRKITAKHR